MGCNCKSSNLSPINGENIIKEKPLQLTLKYVAKTIGFLIALALLPIIMVVIIWFMFDVIILNKNVDLRIILDKFIKHEKYFNSNYEDDDDEDDDDDDEDEYLTEDDVVMLNVEDITNKSK